MCFITYTSVCTGIFILHATITSNYSGILELGFCVVLSCLVYYMTEQESRRSFLWRYFCTPGHSEDYLRSFVVTCSPSLDQPKESPKPAWPTEQQAAQV
jgi:hypothetical protein